MMGKFWKKRHFWGIAAAGIILAAVLAGCGSTDGNIRYGTDETTAASTASGAASPDMTSPDTFRGEQDSSGSSAEAGTEMDMAENSDGGNSVQAEPGSSYEQKLIRTVSMSVETTDFDNLIDSLKAKAEELGGYTENSEINTETGSAAGRWASLTLRIPSDQLDTFLNQVNENANVTYSNESTEDVTLTYTDMESHVAALRAEQESLLSMLENAESMEDILAIQTQLTQVRYEIESYESQLRIYDNQVDYGTVYLNINEVVRETAASGTTFGERIKVRFQENLYRIGTGFTNFAVGFLGAVPVLLILAAVVVIVILTIKKGKKIKKKLDARKQAREEHEEEL